MNLAHLNFKLQKINLTSDKGSPRATLYSLKGVCEDSRHPDPRAVDSRWRATVCVSTALSITTSKKIMSVTNDKSRPSWPSFPRSMQKHFSSLINLLNSCDLKRPQYSAMCPPPKRRSSLRNYLFKRDEIIQRYESTTVSLLIMNTVFSQAISKKNLKLA